MLIMIVRIMNMIMKMVMMSIMISIMVMIAVMTYNLAGWRAVLPIRTIVFCVTPPVFEIASFTPCQGFLLLE